MCLAYQHNPKHADCVATKMAEGKSEGKANGQCKKLQKQGELLDGGEVECCAWTNTRALFNSGTFKGQSSYDYCGTSITEAGSFEQARGQCCANTNATDCDASKWPKGPAFGAMLSFARDEDQWLKFYKTAWKIATTNGHSSLVLTSKFEKKVKQKRERQARKKKEMAEKREKRKREKRLKKMKSKKMKKGRGKK